MTWARTLLTCLLIMTGCTIKVEPLHKKPVKHSYSHHAKKRVSHPKVSPTPTPNTYDRPLQLQPANSPTPIIKIPPTARLMTGEPIML